MRQQLKWALATAASALVLAVVPVLVALGHLDILGVRPLTDGAAIVLVTMSAIFIAHIGWDWARKRGWGKPMGLFLMVSGVVFFCAGAFTLYIETESSSFAEPRQPENLPPLPKVQLSYENDELVFYNRGDRDLYLWGDKFGMHDPEIQEAGSRVPAVSHHYLALADLKSWARRAIGRNGRRQVPLDLYLTDQTQTNRFTGRFVLKIRMNDGEMAIEPRTLPVSRRPW